MPNPLMKLLICAALIAVIDGLSVSHDLYGAAYADDDGGDDGGGDDGGDDDDDGSAGQSDGANPDPRFPRRTQRRTPPPETVPVDLPQAAENEIIALGLTEAQLARAQEQGFDVIEVRDIDILQVQSARLQPPDGSSLEEARAALNAIAPESAADLNHFYRAEQASGDCVGAHCVALEQIAWSGMAPEGLTCLHPATTAATSTATAAAAARRGIGMLDTGINGDHEALADADLELVRLSPDDLAESREQHGTAVASILVGAPDSRSPGLVPDARLVAVDVFHRAGSDERSDAYSLISGLDELAKRRIAVVNLSLAGPPNAPLARMIDRLRATGVLVVSAAGNGGPQSGPVYPGAYDGVIAVTAVDRNGDIYRRAAQGDHVDIAAPGVEVWAAASIRGARPKTGTSFAAPFVTAATYVLLEAGLAPAEVEAKLWDLTVDLGADGKDPVYGHGLLSLAGLCQPQTPAPVTPPSP